MATRRKPPLLVADDLARERLIDEFAMAALDGMLKDPNVNPRNEDAMNRVVDFCWLIARRMVERRPPPQAFH